MLSISTIYTVVYDYLVNNEGIENIDGLLEKWEATDPAKAISGTPALITLCAALRDDMRMEANKAAGKANIDKAMRAIIKNVPEHQRQLQGAFTSDGKQCVCDSYRAIRLNTPLTQVVSAVITLIVAIVSAFLIPYLKSKLGTEKLETVKFWVNIAVEAAEMIYVGTGRGQEKKEYVLSFLNSKGFTLNITEIDNLIEAAVLKLKQPQIN